jgi:hypothetical protein
VKSPQDLSLIVSAHINKNVTMHNLSIAGNWIIVQTNNPTIVPVDGVKYY